MSRLSFKWRRKTKNREVFLNLAQATEYAGAIRKKDQTRRQREAGRELAMACDRLFGFGGNAPSGRACGPVGEEQPAFRVEQGGGSGTSGASARGNHKTRRARPGVEHIRRQPGGRTREGGFSSVDKARAREHAPAPFSPGRYPRAQTRGIDHGR